MFRDVLKAALTTLATSLASYAFERAKAWYQQSGETITIE